MKHICQPIIQCNSTAPNCIIGTCRAWHWTPQSSKIRAVELIRTKTKADSVLFAGYSSSTIEDRTIGLFWPTLWRGFPGFRDKLLSKELVHPHPDKGQLKLMHVGFCTRGSYPFKIIWILFPYIIINASGSFLYVYNLLGTEFSLSDTFLKSFLNCFAN